MDFHVLLPEGIIPLEAVLGSSPQLGRGKLEFGLHVLSTI